MSLKKGCLKTINDFSPKAIADSGQCFRMHSLGEESHLLIAHKRKLLISREGEGVFRFSCSDEEFESIWRGYFDLDSDYSLYRAKIREDDSFLRHAADFGRGIRILRQEPFETLISFIISQRKSVPAIRTSVERLSKLLGEKIDGGSYAFPAPDAIAFAGEDTLRACGLGYRTEYVRQAAREVADGRLDLEELSSLSTEELIDRLMLLSGVGIKVASCAALFSYHRIEVLPKDVWMKRVFENVYAGGLPDEYLECQGVLHQYMFNYARKCGLGKDQQL